MILFRRVFVCFLLLLPVVSQMTGETHAQQNGFTIEQLAGLYRVDGINPNGSKYSGEVNVVVRENIAYFAWSIAGRAYTGQGGIQGNQLVIDWGSSAPVIYNVDQSGNLIGTWNNGQASERLTRLR